MTSALLTALLLSLTAAIIGGFIKNIIWKKSNARTPADYGRAWAAYVAFFVPLSSIHFFIRKELIAALIGFVSALVIFPALFFVCGYAYGFLKIKRFATKGRVSDEAYEAALSELESNSYVKSSWAKALANSGGDEAKARANYIKARVTELMNSQPINLETVSNSDESTVTKPLVIGSGIVVLLLVILFFNASSNSNYRTTQDVPSIVQHQTSTTQSATVTNQTALPISFPSIVGQWRCVAGEDVIDTFEETGIYRRLWVKQEVEFIYKWSITKDGDDFAIDQTEIGGSQIKRRVLIFSATPEQLELVYPSGKVEKCKTIKPKNSSAATQTQITIKSPLLKGLLGKWEMAGNGWTFEYKANGTGEISHKGSQVCGKFSYSLKDNMLSESNFSGTCKIAGGTDSVSLYAVEINGDSMTMKHSNGHITGWTKFSP